MANHMEYYKGESGGFPQVWVVVSFVSIVSLYRPVVCLCRKNVLIMH